MIVSGLNNGVTEQIKYIIHYIIHNLIKFYYRQLHWWLKRYLSALVQWSSYNLLLQSSDFFTPPLGCLHPTPWRTPQTQHPFGVLQCCTPYIYDEQLLSVTVECRQNPTIVILRVAQAAKTLIMCNWLADDFSFDCLWLVISNQYTDEWFDWLLSLHCVT